MKKIICLLCIVLFLISGCGPKLLEPDYFKPQPIEFEKTQSYELDLSSIPKPDPIEPIFVDEKFKKVSASEAKYVLLVPSEYNKIDALLELAIGYKKIAIKEAALINVNIDIINSLKEFIEIERQKAEMYREMWINSENMFRLERHEFQKEKIRNNVEQFFLIIGGVAIIGFLL